MSKTTEVAVPEAAQLPALVNPQARTSSIDAGDITLPRLKRGEGQANAVKTDLVPKGCIYITAGADDPDPIIALAKGDDVGVLIHIIDLKKGKSLEVDGELRTWAFNDPDAPVDARTTYDYAVAIPEIDKEIPAKLLMDKSSTSTAKRINLLIAKNDPQPSYNLAFRITLESRESSKGGTKFQWYVWQAKLVEAEAANVAVAADLAALVATEPRRNDIERTATTEPGI